MPIASSGQQIRHQDSLVHKVIDGRALVTKHLISKRNFRNSLLWQGRSRGIRYHIRVELLRRYEVGCALIIELAH